MKISQTEIAPFETMNYEQPKIVNVWPSSIIGDEASREMSFKIERTTRKDISRSTSSIFVWSDMEFVTTTTAFFIYININVFWG